MKQQEIIAMASEAGFQVEDEVVLAPDGFGRVTDNLERFHALAIAKDRQRLAADVELPEPTYIYHYDPESEAGADDLFEVAKSGRVDISEGISCPHCKQLFTAAQLRDYGDRRAAAERAKHAVAWESDTAKVLQLAVERFTAFLQSNCTGEPPRMEIAYANAVFQALLREKNKELLATAPK